MVFLGIDPHELDSGFWHAASDCAVPDRVYTTRIRQNSIRKAIIVLYAVYLAFLSGLFLLTAFIFTKPVLNYCSIKRLVCALKADIQHDGIRNIIRERFFK